MTLKLKTSTCGIGFPSPRLIARSHPDVRPKVAALGVNDLIFAWEDIQNIQITVKSMWRTRRRGI